MQQLSYPAGDPIFDVAGWRLSAQIITFDNVYGLDSERTAVTTEGRRTVFDCKGLTWAGGTEPADGSARIEARETNDGLEVTVSARHERAIRCVKLSVQGLPKGELIGAFWGRTPISRGGVLLSYPTPLHTPLVFLAVADGSYVCFRSTDDRVRAKRFAFFDAGDGVTAELIFEDPRTRCRHW